MLPIPVSLLGEFINYSLADMDAAKGNIVMGQVNIATPKGFEVGPVNKAILSFHLSKDLPKSEKIDSKTSLIGQLRLIVDKKFNIFAQVFANKLEGADSMSGKGARIWFMYLF